MKFILCLGLALTSAAALAAPDTTLETARALMASQHYAEADELLRQQLAQQPALAEARYLLARSLSWQGRYQAAMDQYRLLLQLEPDNTDYLLGLAQCLVWDRQPQAALPVLAQARELNPEDADLWRLNIQALAAVGGDQREAALALQAQAAQRFPQQSWALLAAEERAEVEAPPQSRPQTPATDVDRQFAGARQQVELGFSHDRLSNGNASWQGMQLDIEQRFAPRQIVYGTLAETKRFALTDYDLAAGVYYPLSPQLTLNAEASFSPEHKVLPRTTALATLQYAFGDGWAVTGGLRHAEYNSATATQVPLTLERYFGPFRIAYSPTPTFVQDKTLYDHRLQFSYYYSDISFINLSYSRGEEANRFISRFVINDVYYAGVNGRHWFNADWAMTWELAHTSQGGLYERNGVRLGLRRAF